MNIAIICSEYPPVPHGGIGTFTQIIARTLVQSGHQVRVIGIYSDLDATTYEDDHGVRVWRLVGPLSLGRWLLRRYDLFNYLSAWASKGEIDLVEVPDYEGPAAYWPSLKVPVICRVHSHESYTSTGISLLNKQLMRANLERADYWCAVSKYAANLASRFAHIGKPDAILYNPVETKSPLATVERSKHDVIFTGTLAQSKGIISLVKAWSLVKQSHEDAILHIYGKDTTYNNQSMISYLKSIIDTNIGNSIIFHGHTPRSALFIALQKARLAVFPSYSEAFAIAPLEAMSQGCPTIFTIRASGSELIDNGINGILVDPDDISAIANAISRLLIDDELALRLGVNGFQHISQSFSFETILPQNLDFYLSCMYDFNRKNA